MAALSPGRRRPARPAAATGPRAGGAGPLPVWLAAAAALAALALLHPDLWRTPFLNDDYVFLDRVASRGFVELWGFDALPFDWWRPWSREWHYWSWSRLAGPNETVFHAVSLTLAGLVLALYFGLARTLIGAPRAALALAGVAAMAAWGVPVLWVAGVQDLWMLLWSLAALTAWSRGRPGFAALGYALALMSKETAAPLPLVCLAWDVARERRPWREAARRLAPMAVLALAWAAAHPQLGGVWLRGETVTAAPPEVRLAWPLRWVRALLMLVSLDRAPAPYGGLAPVVAALPAALVLAALVAAAGRGTRHARPPARGTGAVALAWTVAGFLPLLLPTIGWQAYYGLLGALGAWLGLASRMPLRPPAWAALAAALTLLGAARADTASMSWGDTYYQRRAARMVREARAQVRAAAPVVAPHTRLWFSGLPDRIGFLQGDGPALRLLYGDPTLRAGYWSDWSPPPPGAPGADRFFRMHPGPRLVEVHPDGADRADPRYGGAEWTDDLQALALQFDAAGEPGRAGRVFELVARARPLDAEPAYNAAVMREAQGDEAGAREWFAEAARRPERSPRLLAVARASGRTLFEPSGAPAGPAGRPHPGDAPGR